MKRGGARQAAGGRDGVPGDWDEFLAAARMRGIHLSPGQQEQIRTYVALLLEWGRRVNLTGANTEGEILLAHVLDSLLALPLLARAASGWPCLRAIDVGTGAGLPGLPLAIAVPPLRLVLLEATRKKALFLEQAALRLRLENVEVVEGRAETLAHRESCRESFPLAFARALAPLPVLAELTLPFLRVGGLLLAYKGPGWEEEQRQAERALETLGGRPIEVEETALPGSRRRRALLLVRKVSPTPPRYPRRAGMPAKRPL